MKKRLRFLLLLFMLICTGCGSTTGSPANSRTADSSANSLVKPSARDILQKSIQAMDQLKTVHYTMDAHKKPITMTNTPSTNILHAFQVLSGFNESQLKGDGDWTANISRFSLKEVPLSPHSGRKYSLDQYMQGDTVYLLGGLNDQTWYAIDRANIVSNNYNPIYVNTGVPQLKSYLQMALAQASLSSKGREYLMGKTVYHVVATISDPNIIFQLVLLDYQNHSWGMNVDNFTPQKGVIDLWIEKQSNYIIQLHSSLTLKFDQDRGVQQTVAFQCSHYDEPLTLTLPSPVYPANSLDEIFPFHP